VEDKMSKIEALQKIADMTLDEWTEYAQDRDISNATNVAATAQLIAAVWHLNQTRGPKRMYEILQEVANAVTTNEIKRLQAALKRIADDDVDADLKGRADILSGIAHAALLNDDD
jgi:hypothetical protein